MNKRFIRTTSSKFESVNKEQYKDCIIFIEDTKEIWMNGNYYGRNDNEDSNILYDLETGLDLNGDQVKTVDKLIIDQNGLVYSNNELVINNIKVNSTIIEKDDNGVVEIPVGDLNVQSDWNEEDETSDAYIKNKPELFNGDYDNLTNKPTLFSGNYDDLTNKPSVISKEEFDTLKQEVEENEEVVAGALVDLNSRIDNSIQEIKMNNTSKGTSGIIDLGTVVTDAVISQAATDASITDGVLTIPAIAGEKGEDGYTPVKGADYFTEADKQEFIEEIKDKLSASDISYDGSDLNEDITNVDVALTYSLTKEQTISNPDTTISLSTKITNIILNNADNTNLSFSYKGQNECTIVIYNKTGNSIVLPTNYKIGNYTTVLVNKISSVTLLDQSSCEVHILFTNGECRILILEL